MVGRYFVKSRFFSVIGQEDMLATNILKTCLFGIFVARVILS